MDKTYSCPKCGKKIAVSTQSLISSDYKIICPQCLSQLQIVGGYAYIPREDGSLQLDASQPAPHDVTCPHCGSTVSSHAHFCPNCGNSMDTGAPAASTALDIAPEEVTVLPPPPPATGDPLYDEAVKFLATCTAITPMMLRDRFGISDERAAQLIQQLEARGVIGPYNNGGPRQILIPHQPLMGYGVPVDDGGNGNAPAPTTRRNRGSCITWFVVIAFCIFMFKTCTGT